MAGRSRILFVEDDRDLVACLQAVFDEDGWEVITASDGASAIEACRRQPTLAFIDLHIEGPLSGAALIQAMRRLLPPEARLYLLSGDRDLSQRAHELGADGWLEKPFDVEDLFEIVERESTMRVAEAHPPDRP